MLIYTYQNLGSVRRRHFGAYAEADGRIVGVEDDTATEPIIYAVGKTVIVENATNEILVYDAMGNLVGRGGRDVPWRVSTGTLTITVNVSGVYIVKTGNMVMRVVAE